MGYEQYENDRIDAQQRQNIKNNQSIKMTPQSDVSYSYLVIFPAT